MCSMKRLHRFRAYTSRRRAAEISKIIIILELAEYAFNQFPLATANH